MLKKFLDKLKRKRVHQILEPNSTFIHRSFATFCEPFPATSTTIAEGLRIQADLSDHSFAFNGSTMSTDQNSEISDQVKVTFERSFRRYFGDIRAFSMKNIRCSVDAYNSWIRFKHARDTLQQMVDFCAGQSRRLEGFEPLMDTYFRCFYDFVSACMSQLECAFPGLHAYHSNRQSVNNGRFYTVRLPRQSRFSASNSSGYTSLSGSSTSSVIQQLSIYASRNDRRFGPISEWDEHKIPI